MENIFENIKFKIIATISVLFLVILIGYYIIILQAPQREKSINIALQNQCASRAKIVFNSIRASIISINYTYTSHYNINLNKCYALIHGIGVGNTGISDKLIDVYINQNIADCESYSTSPELNYCVYNGGANSPYNINEFNDFIAPYMTNE